MAELGSGQEAAVERRLAAMRATAATGAEAAHLYRTVGIPLVEGLAAFHRGAYDQAVELLLQVRFDLWRIGGSHAQRDVVNWTLTRGGDTRRSAGCCLVIRTRTSGGPSAQRPQSTLSPACRGHRGLMT